MLKEDRTEHSFGARARPKRSTTDAVLIHRFGGPGVALTFDDAIRFWTKNPEGLATTLLAGTYAEKLPIIEKWRRDGVPDQHQGKRIAGRGFVPYHFLVDGSGRVARMLALEARGAHAGSYNWKSVAVACLGDFRAAAPPEPQVAATIALLRDILAVYPNADVIDHDEANRRMHLPVKGCVGDRFPLARVRASALS